VHSQYHRLDPLGVVFASLDCFKLDRLGVWARDCERRKVGGFTVDHYSSVLYDGTRQRLTVNLVIEFQSFSLYLTSSQLTLMRDDSEIDIVMALIRLWIRRSGCSDK